MKADRQVEEKVRKLLASAYGARDDFEPGMGWEKRVAARLAEARLLSHEVSFLPAFEHFVWKLTPATLTTCAVLTVLLAWHGNWTGLDGIQLLSNYLEELPLWRIFGV
jgi:hypothetical protein